jgi:hypothetical protein
VWPVRVRRRSRLWDGREAGARPGARPKQRLWFFLRFVRERPAFDVLASVSRYRAVFPVRGFHRAPEQARPILRNAPPVLSEAARRTGRCVAPAASATRTSASTARPAGGARARPSRWLQAAERLKLSCEPANLVCTRTRSGRLQHPVDVVNNGIRRVSCSALLGGRSCALPVLDFRLSPSRDGWPGPRPGQRRAHR